MAEELAFRLSIEGAEQELRNIEDLRQAVRQLEENLETADFGSEAFKRAEKELKAARGELYKFDRQLEALEDPVKGAEKWVKYGEGVAGAFAAAQGAAAIFGVENENVEKMVVKAQGAVAVAMGARMLAESQLLTVLKESKLGMLALDAIEKVRIGTTLASAAATRVLHAAMIAVGIGVVTGLVAVLVANWKNLTEGVKALAKQFVNLVPGMGKVVGFFGRIRDAVVDLGQSLNLVASDAEMATKRMAKAAGKLADEEAEAFKKRKEIAQAAGQDTLAMEEEHLRGRVEHLRQAAADGNEERQKEYDDALHQLDVFLAAKGKREADAQASAAAAAEKRRKEREEQDESDRQAEMDAEMARVEQLEKDYDQRIRLAQARGEDTKALEMEAQQALVDELDKIRATNEEAEARYQDELFNLRVMRTERERELELEHQEYMRGLNDAAREAQREDEEEADEESAAEEAEMLESLGSFFNRKLELIRQGHSLEKAEAIATAERLQEIEEEKAAARAAVIESSMQALGTVLGSMDQNSKRTQALQKTLTLAQIAYDTGRAISSVIASATAAAAALGPGAPFAIGPYIAQGLAVVLPGIASAYAALRKAPGGGGGSAPSVNLPTFAPPEVEQRTGNATTAEGEFGGGAFGPARAYVVGSDVSSDMEARQRVEDLASLGG